MDLFPIHFRENVNLMTSCEFVFRIWFDSILYAVDFTLVEFMWCLSVTGTG